MSHLSRKAEADTVLASELFTTQLAQLATSLGRSVADLRGEARKNLMGMASEHHPLFTWLMDRTLGPMHTNAWAIDVEAGALQRLAQASAQHPLVFLPSHRSYADAFVLRKLFQQAGLSPNHILGGDNLSFFPMGTIARRAGGVFIRRSFKDDEVYKLALRSYLRHLAARGANLEWYMEGGRSRTGKLRPPKYGLLSYLVDAINRGAAPEIYLVPVAIAYDQLHEVRKMAAEEAGLPKAKEGIGWLLDFARQGRNVIGTAYVRFGEPFALSNALGSRGATEASAARWSVDKVAFEVFQRINRSTPVTSPALVTLALLGVHDHALTLQEVRAAIAPLLDYAARRGLPTAALQPVHEAAGVEAALGVLVKAGVVRRYDAGLEPVFNIEPGKHSEAAYYRNNAIHWFVNRAIVELGVMVALREGSGDPVQRAWDLVFSLRDLLKFEFFFSEKPVFSQEIIAEGALLDHAFEARLAAWAAHQAQRATQGDVAASPVPSAANGDWGTPHGILERAPFLIAHRVLPAFLEAYFLVADRLLAHPPGQPVNDKAFLEQCLSVGRQYLLQKRLRNPECISRELFGNALALAANRGLLQPGSADLVERRRRFAQETAEAVAAVAVIGDLDFQRRRRAQEQH